MLNYCCKIDTIVVLGGSARNFYPEIPVTSQLSYGSTYRLLEAIRLYYLLDKPKIIISGGGVYIKPSKIMANLAEILGIPENKIVCGIKSRDTFENAKEVKKLVGDNPFVLVTSAYHLPRSMFVFKKLGLNPIPAPADYLAQGKRYTLFSFFPSYSNITRCNLVFHEYLGFIWYKLLYT